MRSFVIGISAFVIWSIIARWHYVCEIKNNCGIELTSTSEREKSNQRPNDLDFIDEGHAILQNYEQFLFPKQSYNPELSQNNVDLLVKLIEFFEKHPNKDLVITGFQGMKELDSQMRSNLGLLRAEAIKSELIRLGMRAEKIKTEYGNSVDASKKPIRFNVIK